MTTEHDTFELHTERWCVGLRECGSRPLDAAERAMLDARIHDLQLRLWSIWITAPITFAVPFVFALWIPHVPGLPWLGAVASTVLVAIAVLWPMLLLLRARSTSAQRARHRLDLEAGEMLRFEGAFARGEALDPDQRRLMEAGVLIPEPDVEQKLEVLPNAELAVFRRGRLVGVQPVSLREVAAGPGYAMRVEVPPEMARLDNAPDARFLRRTLNSHERAEIAAHIHRLRRPGIPMILWSCWITAWAVALAWRPQAALAYLQTQWMFALAPLVFLVLVGTTYARALRLASRLEEDTRTGWALTLHRPDRAAEAEPPVEAPSSEDGLPDPNACVEFLPHSRALWIERGRPARWRNLRRAA